MSNGQNEVLPMKTWGIRARNDGSKEDMMVLYRAEKKSSVKNFAAHQLPKGYRVIDIREWEPSKELEELRAAVLASHPMGVEGAEDPLKILKDLEQTFMEHMHHACIGPIEFFENDGTKRKLVWHTGEPGVNVPEGYAPDEDEGDTAFDKWKEEALRWKDKAFTCVFCKYDARKGQIGIDEHLAVCKLHPVRKAAWWKRLFA